MHISTGMSLRSFYLKQSHVAPIWSTGYVETHAWPLVLTQKGTIVDCMKIAQRVNIVT